MLSREIKKYVFIFGFPKQVITESPGFILLPYNSAFRNATAFQRQYLAEAAP